MFLDLLAEKAMTEAILPSYKRVNYGARIAIYLVLNFSFLLVVVTASVISGGGASPLYLCLLFLTCSLPILFVDKANGRYVILVIFMFLYFVFYGLSDLMALLPEFRYKGIVKTGGMFDDAEQAILVGALMFIGGYASSISAFGRKRSNAKRSDWPLRTIILVGFVSWFFGLIATWIWQFSYGDRHTQAVLTSAGLGVVFILLRMLQPVGVALIVYASVVSKHKALFIWLLGILSIEFVFGFLADSKELSIRALIILMVGKFMIDGRIPKTWFMVFGIVIVLTFSLFQAYRAEIFQTRDMSREAAMQNLSKNINKALQSKTLKEGGMISSIKGFVGRTNLKGNMLTIVSRTGKDVPFQGGYTIGLVFYAFVPRLILPNKPDSSVGQLFNREFKISADPDTYISATHLGELYWNFGWPGIVVGMFVIGGLMGAVNARYSLSEHANVMKFLILVTTIYLLCLRFEGGIALQYTLWIRSILLILIMNYLFRRAVS